MNKDEMKYLHWGNMMITVETGALDLHLHEHRPVRQVNRGAWGHKTGWMWQQLQVALVLINPSGSLTCYSRLVWSDLASQKWSDANTPSRQQIIYISLWGPFSGTSLKWMAKSPLFSFIVYKSKMLFKVNIKVNAFWESRWKEGSPCCCSETCHRVDQLCYF